jgi:hypothetical protein
LAAFQAGYSLLRRLTATPNRKAASRKRPFEGSRTMRSSIGER